VHACGCAALADTGEAGQDALTPAGSPFGQRMPPAFQIANPNNPFSGLLPIAGNPGLQ
jgi:hypothetical protein